MRLRRIDVVQYAWNMFDRRMQAEIFPYCAAQHVAVMAYGSLAYGMLSGTFHAGMAFDEDDWRSKRRQSGRPQSVPHHVRARAFPAQPGRGRGVEALAAKYGKTLPQFALRWTLSNPVVGTALVGFRTPSRGERKSWRARLGDQQRRHGRGRRHFCPSRRVTVPPGWLED